jgi:ribosomal protein L14
MSRRPANVTQAAIARALRAAQQCGAGPVRIQPDGTILINPQPEPLGDRAENPVADDAEVVL